MNSRSKEMQKYYSEHILKEDDTFNFKCKMCGLCCIRDEDEPVIVMGPDLVRIARKLHLSTLDVIRKYCYFNIGEKSGLPVLTLKTDWMRRCIFLQNARCMVHDAKPEVCAMFPLGRMVRVHPSRENGEASYAYFTQPGGGCPGENTDVTCTLREWKEKFHLEEREKEMLAWNNMLPDLMAIADIYDRADPAEVFLSQALYDFDPAKDLIPQIEKNHKIAKEVLAKAQEMI